MRDLDFYEIVEVVDTPETRELGIAGKRGVVVGLPPHLLGIEDDPVPPEGSRGHQYSVTVADTGFALYRDEIEPTGARATRDDVFDASSMSVTVHGDPVEGDEEAGS